MALWPFSERTELHYSWFKYTSWCCRMIIPNKNVPLKDPFPANRSKAVVLFFFFFFFFFFFSSFFGRLFSVATGLFMSNLALLFVLVFFQSFYHWDHLAWEREGWFMSFSCICLFILHVLMFVLFPFLLVSEVGCDMWLWHSLDVSIGMFACTTATDERIQWNRVWYVYLRIDCYFFFSSPEPKAHW